jgi:hypothetical protein
MALKEALKSAALEEIFNLNLVRIPFYSRENKQNSSFTY